MAKTLTLFMIKSLTFLCCAILYITAHGQNNILFTNTLQNTTLKEQEPIFRGAEYRPFPPTSGGIIYFQSDTLTRGDVIYHNRLYKNVPLLYDQLTDELVTLTLDGGSLIRLYTPKVQGFNIYNSDFIYLPDSASAATGKFWEILFDPKLKIFKKEVKTIEIKVVDHKMARVVRQQIKYRLFLNNADLDISGKQALIEALSDQKPAIGTFMKTNRRRFRKSGFETMIRETVNYYHEIAARK
jgi:hypothetical protein